jgi:hypothetical protein
MALESGSHSRNGEPLLLREPIIDSPLSHSIAARADPGSPHIFEAGPNPQSEPDEEDTKPPATKRQK